MRKKIANQFLYNYILMFINSSIITLFALMLIDFANHVIADTLIKENYTATRLMKNDYQKIDSSPVVLNGGGIQVINSDYEVIYSTGLNTIKKEKLTSSEFNSLLQTSKNFESPFSYSIQYNPDEKFWLLVTFPASLRIDLLEIGSKDYASVDTQNLIGAIVAIIIFYLLLLAASTVIYSKVTSFSIINPLKDLCNSARRLRDGDYSVRTNLNLQNEFAELQDTFNAMAKQIEHEIALREQSEENRKKLILDISHDLKNPLASIMGYAEFCYKKENLTKEELDTYTQIIYTNSTRANSLITDLFELSKLEAPGFLINKANVDICEFVREEIGKSLSSLDEAGFDYIFDIPEKELFIMLDTVQMDRVFENLVSNAIRYNPRGTQLMISLEEQNGEIILVFKDNGIGIPAEFTSNIFEPFIRTDTARNSQTGGTGLGLAIVKKVISAHGGSIYLKTDRSCGCEFIIHLPKI